MKAKVKVNKVEAALFLDLLEALGAGTPQGAQVHDRLVTRLASRGRYDLVAIAHGGNDEKIDALVQQILSRWPELA